MYKLKDIQNSKHSFFSSINSGILIAVILSLSIILLGSQIPIIRNVKAQETNEITLYGSSSQGWGFSENSMSIPGPTIEFQEEEMYNLTLISADGLIHSFFVDYNGNNSPDSNEPVSPSFTSTINFQFTPDRTGEFTYYCSYHPITMFGNASLIPEFNLQTLILVIATLSAILITYRKMKN